jgi:hypothetical protein
VEIIKDKFFKLLFDFSKLGIKYQKEIINLINNETKGDL